MIFTQLPSTISLGRIILAIRENLIQGMLFSSPKRAICTSLRNFCYQSVVQISHNGRQAEQNLG